MLGALVAGVAPLAARDLDAVGASLAVLRDASISEEALAALGALGPLAKLGIGRVAGRQRRM